MHSTVLKFSTISVPQSGTTFQWFKKIEYFPQIWSAGKFVGFVFLENVYIWLMFSKTYSLAINFWDGILFLWHFDAVLFFFFQHFIISTCLVPSMKVMCFSSPMAALKCFSMSLVCHSDMCYDVYFVSCLGFVILLDFLFDAFVSFVKSFGNLY